MNQGFGPGQTRELNSGVTHLSDTWLKASVLGANWAASEIILGSFLHNLHIPFKGSILTAIGLVLLITASHKWEDKGLFWRAGLVCALMKTMSPSAVIFGPMVAIFMEAMLFGLAVNVIGRNLGGYLAGSFLAMVWVLAQKLFNYVLYYGFNIVEIYKGVVDYAERQLELNTDLFWFPLIALLTVYLAFGLLATIVGIRIGRRLDTPLSIPVWEANNVREWSLNKARHDFPYSIPWLLFSFVALISTLVIINRSPLWLWMPFTVLLVGAWVRRYRRGLRQISRPRFWIFFAVITTLSALLITSLNGAGADWKDGLLIGVQMNFRAAVVVTGFAVLGTELYNPRIREYFERTSFRQLPIAMELAFESLPDILSRMPAASWFIRRPMQVVRLLIHNAEEKIRELRRPNMDVYIISGEIASGKTHFLEELYGLLTKSGISANGVVMPRVVQDGITAGYDVKILGSDIRLPFLRSAPTHASPDIGRFLLDQDSLSSGQDHLYEALEKNMPLIIMDEIGKLELRGQGWNGPLSDGLMKGRSQFILSVRKEFMEIVLDHYSIKHPIVFHVGDITPKEAMEQILGRVPRP